MALHPGHPALFRFPAFGLRRMPGWQRQAQLGDGEFEAATIATALGLDAAIRGTAIRARNHQSSIINYQSRRAFTLLELLVAMTLMMATASCLYTALYTAFRAQRSALAAVEPTAQAINVIELLKQDICGVLAPGSGLAGAFIGTDSGGIKGVDADSLEFYTTHVSTDTESGQLAGGLGKIGLLLEEDTETRDGTYLLLRQVTRDLLAPKEVEPEEQVLCRHVVSLNLRYFDGTGWVEDWDSTADANSLPRAVEIEIQIAHNGTHARNVRSNEELQKRRLVQSFAIPCETAEETESETTTGGTTTGGTATGGAATGGTAP